MRIDSNSQTGATEFLKRAATSQTQAAQTEKKDEATVNSIDPLKRALEATSDVRADQVARAKALIAGGAYPTDKDLDQVAGLLADKLSASSTQSAG